MARKILTPEQQQAKAARKKEQARIAQAEEIAALNNVRTKAPTTSKSKKKAQVGPSKKNRKGEQRRVKRYNDRVWPGWRESDGVRSPVKTYKASDLKEPTE